MNKAYKTYTNDELFAHLKANDLLAYREIYDRYHAVLFIHAYKRLQDKEECRDIIQNLFAMIWERRDELEIGNNLPGYLYAAVRNSIFNLLQKNKLKDEHIKSMTQFEKVWSSHADFSTRENQLKMIIEKEIELLPPRTREVFKLSRNEYLSHKQIAEKLEISEQTVKTTVNNALKTLRMKLGPLYFLFF